MTERDELMAEDVEQRVVVDETMVKEVEPRGETIDAMAKDTKNWKNSVPKANYNFYIIRTFL